VKFDESNGSQGDGFCCDDVGKEPLREAMKKMAIGDIKLREDDDPHSILENSSSDDDNDNDPPRHLHHPQDKIVHLPHKNHLLSHKTLKIK
jgi:hypothetical protein